MKSKMNSNLDKLERINHLETNSLIGTVAALFVSLVFNYFLCQTFFSYFKAPSIGIVWFVPFYMIQISMLRVIYRKISSGKLVFSSPFSKPKELISFILLLIFGGSFICFSFGLFYPFTIYSASPVNEIIFYLVSFVISIFYWKYVELYKRKKGVYVTKISDFKLYDYFMMTLVLGVFGGIALFMPYVSQTGFDILGFGVWFIMISRFLLE